MEATKAAYPYRRDLMDEDLADWEECGMTMHPVNWCRWQRRVIHKLMRIAFEEEASYVLDDLEKHRQHVAAQLAYVLAHEERKRAELEATNH